MANKATVADFERHTGTTIYHKFDEHYALTDGIIWLRNQMPADDFYVMCRLITQHMSYKLPFGFFTLNVTDDYVDLITTDGDNNRICRNILSDDPNKTGYNLENGTYKIWCQNYVIFAASEY